MGKNLKINVKNKKEEDKLLKFLNKEKIKFISPNKPGMGQKKGKKFEKEIAKKISVWWTNGERDDVFYLTSGSGSRYTFRKKVGKDTKNSSGDIGILDPIGQPFLNIFSIEAKNGYSNKLDIMSIIDGKKDQKHIIFDWALKAQNEVDGTDKECFIIIIKRDRKNKVVVIEPHFLTKPYFGKGFTGKEIVIVANGYELSIVDYDDFFKQLDPKIIKKMYK